jgi:HaeII restriction endonuclease.
MELQIAKECLDDIIKKGRVHLYKPIQIAEILYHDRIDSLDLADLSTYMNASGAWRDVVTKQITGNTCSSSQKFQQDLFRAVNPEALIALSDFNKENEGLVEAYIYNAYRTRLEQLKSASMFIKSGTPETFKLKDLLDSFWKEPGLKRSIDKVYEIVVYALFSVLIEALEVSIEVGYNYNEKGELLKEFEDFSNGVIGLSEDISSYITKANIYRVGVTNAADRGLDMWGNFGISIQIKHLSLSEELAESIVGQVTNDRIIIVCRDSEEKVIKSLLVQLGWKARIQSIIVESQLIDWYEKAMRGRFKDILGNSILSRLSNEMNLEFPATKNENIVPFITERGYQNIDISKW